MADTDPTLGIALERLQRLVEVGFAQTAGDTRLILQRLDQMDTAQANLTKRVDDLEDRVSEVDKSAVTREQLTDRTRLIFTFVTVLVGVVSLIFTAVQVFTR